MAGRKQHYIPRQFLKAFSLSPSDKNPRVWVYRRDGPTFPSSIASVAAEREFYSPLSLDGKSTLDEEITTYEFGLTNLLSSLRFVKHGQRVDPAIASEVVSHLTIRNAHIRDTMAEALGELFSRVSDVFGSEERLKPFLGIDSKNPSQSFIESIDRIIDSEIGEGNLPFPRPVLHQMAFMLMKEKFNRVFVEQVPTMALAIETIALQSNSLARESHNKSLRGVNTSTPRTSALEKLRWRIEEVSYDFILPDCVALGIEQTGGVIPFAFSGVEELRFVLMPITKNKMLIGSSSDNAYPRLRTFNDAAAAASSTFFIAAENNSNYENLKSSIGSDRPPQSGPIGMLV